MRKVPSTLQRLEVFTVMCRSIVKHQQSREEAGKAVGSTPHRESPVNLSEQPVEAVARLHLAGGVIKPDCRMMRRLSWMQGFA